MSHARCWWAINRASGRSNWNSSSWNQSFRSTSHQHVEAARERPCTADAIGPRIIMREPPAGQKPSPSRNHRSVKARSTTESATWLSGGPARRSSPAQRGTAAGLAAVRPVAVRFLAFMRSRSSLALPARPIDALSVH